MSNKITYDDKISIVAKSVHKNQWWDDDANEIKDKHNLNDDRITSLESGQITGIASYATLALLQSSGSETLNVVYKVTNDSTPGNNGTYHWTGTIYEQDLLVNNGIVEPNNVESVQGGELWNLFNRTLMQSVDGSKMNNEYSYLTNGSVKTTPSPLKRLKLNYRFNGYLLRSTGAYVYNTFYESTDFLPTSIDYEAYSFAPIPSPTAAAICYYDEYYVFISSEIYGDTTLGKPANAVYFRISRLADLNAGYDNMYYTYGVLNNFVFDTSSLTESGYIARADGSLVANTYYLSSDFIDFVPEYKILLTNGSHGSVTACDFAFYDSEFVFISANSEGSTKLNIPSNAVYFKICADAIDIDNFYGMIGFDGVDGLETFGSSIMFFRDNYWQGERIDSPTDIFDTKIIDDLVPAPITLDGGGAHTKNFESVEMYTENITANLSFLVSTSDPVSVSVGKGNSSIELTSTNILIYGIPSGDANPVLEDTFTLPFPVVEGESYSIGFVKTSNDVTYYALSQGIEWTQVYTKISDELACILWGRVFCGVNSGRATLSSCPISIDYQQAKLWIMGDSFIEGSSVVSDGLENRWCAKLAAQIGAEYVVIDGKGGEKIDTDFNTRFRKEIAYNKPKYVMISLGTNNYADIPSYQTHMTNCIALAKSNGVIPVLVTCTPRPGFDYATTVAVINQFVKDSGELYVDMHKAVTEPLDPSSWIPSYVLPDGTHPTVAGHEVMFQQIKINVPLLYQL